MIGNKLAAGREPNHSSFKPGQRPWNANLKGIHLSPDSEFKKGRKPDEPIPVGSVRIRTERRGVKRAYIKVGEPNRWKLRAVLVWETAKGSVPKGSTVHHKDRNTINDDIENLVCLTRAEHIKEHQREIREARWPEYRKASLP